jgi:hypothetical protein
LSWNPELSNYKAQILNYFVKLYLPYHPLTLAQCKESNPGPLTYTTIFELLGLIFFFFLNFQARIFPFLSLLTTSDSTSKVASFARRQWLMAVILATQAAEIRRIAVRSQPGQIVCKTLCWKKKKSQKRAGEVVQGVGP